MLLFAGRGGRDRTLLPFHRTLHRSFSSQTFIVSVRRDVSMKPAAEPRRASATAGQNLAPAALALAARPVTANTSRDPACRYRDPVWSRTGASGRRGVTTSFERARPKWVCGAGCSGHRGSTLSRGLRQPHETSGATAAQMMPSAFGSCPYTGAGADSGAFSSHGSSGFDGGGSCDSGGGAAAAAVMDNVAKRPSTSLQSCLRWR